MVSVNAHSHYRTLKGWTKSAEFNRTKLIEQVQDAPAGVYKVKMIGSDSWQVMDKPPVHGASEWLYLSEAGIPIYYWNRNQEGLTII